MRSEFEKFLRSQWEEKSFPMDPEHRQDMEALLKKNRRRKPVWIWWAGGVSLVAIILFVALHLTQNAQEHLPVDSPDKKHNIEHVPVVSAESTVVQIETSNSLDTSNDDHSASPSSGVEQETSNSNIPSKNTLSQKSKDRSSAHLPSKGKAITINDSKTLNSTTDSRSKGNPSANETVVSQAGMVDSNISHAQNTFDPTQTNDDSVLNYTTNNEEGKSDLMLNENNVSGEKRAIVAGPDVDVLEYNLLRKIEDVEALDPLALNGIEYNADPIAPNIQDNSVNKRKWYLFATVQGAYLHGSQITYNAGYILGGGLGLGFQILPGVGMRIKGGYARQKNGFSFERVSSRQSPSFGTRSISNRLQPKVLHYADGSLSLDYLLKRNILSLNLGLRYLYGAQGSYVAQVDDQFLGTKLESDDFAWLNTSGLSTWYGLIGVSWGYRINSRLSAGLGFNFQTPGIQRRDLALKDEGYSWSGTNRNIYPFAELQYRFYGN